ncbi:hypothetical protein E2562_003720 [Oryza meyeriana var. granulata]|uniref:Uncharacterized protein n=1 Tax=Oryza meyeriana var. granulata TaxID=110450 RepID=A0A6G1C3V7_9ORYZ|nr:hypothetical protein E2562_003720 [Oryza meyeriana var. granulata]
MQTFLNLFGPGTQGGSATQDSPAFQTGQTNQAYRNQANYGEFMRTKLPVFFEAKEPLEAEDWLRVIEKKMDLIRAREEDKVRFTTS